MEETLVQAIGKIPGVTVTSADYIGGALHVFIQATSSAVNLLAWAGCHRWWNWGEDFSLEVDLADPSRDSETIDLIIASENRGSADRALHKFTEDINKFISEWVDKNPKPSCGPCDTDKVAIGITFEGDAFITGHSRPTGGDCGGSGL